MSGLPIFPTARLGFSTSQTESSTSQSLAVGKMGLLILRFSPFSTDFSYGIHTDFFQ